MQSWQDLPERRFACATSIFVVSDMDEGVPAMNRCIYKNPGCCAPLDQSGRGFTSCALVGCEVIGSSDLVSVIFVNINVGN